MMMKARQVGMPRAKIPAPAPAPEAPRRRPRRFAARRCQQTQRTQRHWPAETPYRGEGERTASEQRRQSNQHEKMHLATNDQRPTTHRFCGGFASRPAPPSSPPSPSRLVTVA